MDIFNEVVGRHMGGQLIPVTRFGSTMQTFTPQWVVKDMIALLPDQVWNEHTTFLDISCKTGIFLMEIYKKLDEVLSKNPKYEDTATRRSHILNEQLYGLALDDKECLWYSSRNVYGRIGAKNMKYLHAGGYSYDQLVKNKKVEYMKALIQEEFGRNMFDVVVGNPPYNNDIYLDFVTLAKSIQTQNVCMITPAKWQAKGGPKNEAFRRDIVPYMSKIVYYPYTNDVFDIQLQGGVSAYSLGKQMKVEKDLSIRTRCTERAASIKNEEVVYNVHRKTMYNTDVENIIEKCISDGTLKFNKCSVDSKLYNVKITNVWSGQLNSIGIVGCMPVITEPYIDNDNTDKNIHTSCLGTFKTLNEAQSFISYFKTRLVRFLLAMGAHTVQFMNKETWRFVPDPGKFDHIFTDQELYKKYNLTDDEINIIESVIKERK